MVLAPASRANTFTGQLTVNAGFVNARTDDALGSLKTNEVVRIATSFPDEQQTLTFSNPEPHGRDVLSVVQPAPPRPR